MHPPLDSLRHWGDFERYARALVATRDADPVYPLIGRIVERERVEPEWFAFVYVLYYSLGSAVRVCREIPTSADFSAGRFARVASVRGFGIERRGSQRAAANLVRALEAWRELRPTLVSWQRRVDCHRFRALVRTLPQHSNWAAFKLCEVHEKGLGHANLRPLSMEVGARDVNSSRGPGGGCRELYGPGVFPQSIAAEWEELGVSITKRLGCDLGETETALCKWSKVCKGQYFIGHDIHEFAALRPLWEPEVFDGLMRACRFPEPLWNSHIDVRAAKRAYLSSRELIFADLA